MRTRSRALAALLACLLPAGLFLLLAASLGGLEPLDTAGLSWARSLHGPTLDLLMYALTWWGDTIGMTIQALLVLGLLLWRRPAGWGRDLTLLLLALPIGFGLNILLKELYQRPRPTLFPPLFEESDPSFPSGHAMASLCFYGALLWVIAPRLRRRLHLVLAGLAAGMLVMLVSFSRIYGGVHYPTDILGGMVAGLAWLVLCGLILRALSRRRGSAEAQPRPDLPDAGTRR